MAHALQIDTLAFSKKLRDAGADEKLAEAIVDGGGKIIAPSLPPPLRHSGQPAAEPR